MVSDAPLLPHKKQHSNHAQKYASFGLCFTTWHLKHDATSGGLSRSGGSSTETTFDPATRSFFSVVLSSCTRSSSNFFASAATSKFFKISLWYMLGGAAFPIDAKTVFIQAS
eukprot:CAMPEP_0168195726 /NCGR_PEP_ID=MMETSP0139_2-20121125/20039_1 /TAXON_ID=44445 /ORGANISM="Pseudo-nitzschia australis, Strain 10249 10 AB" /LENGTH=111 /DNA_ID=CAMNT_0008119659 /DNA_START=99 /DNA_END=434 /DNA_ORIENTATION=-